MCVAAVANMYAVKSARAQLVSDQSPPPEAEAGVETHQRDTCNVSQNNPVRSGG